MKKKLAAVVLSLAMVLSLVACGDNSSGTGGGTTSGGAGSGTTNDDAGSGTTNDNAGGRHPMARPRRST